MRIFTVGLAFASLALAGCQQSTEESAPDDGVESAQAPSATSRPTPETTGDNANYDPAQPGAGNEYSYIDLLELRDGDTQIILDNMENVGGCSFRTKDDRLLLVVGSPDDRTVRGIGVARPNGKGARKFVAEQPGMGYIDAGPVLVHDGAGTMEPLTLTLTHPEGEGTSVGVETIEWPARLLVSDPNGERAPYLGTWSCGV